MPTTPPLFSKNALIWVVPLVIILGPIAYSIMAPLILQGAESGQPFLEKAVSNYHGGCALGDPTVVRYRHWEILKDIREEIVRYGDRKENEIDLGGGKRVVKGLSSCKECHLSRERFCDQCHNAVSLFPDCFDCHNYP